jgi:hypothetical protein
LHETTRVSDLHASARNGASILPAISSIPKTSIPGLSPEAAEYSSGKAIKLARLPALSMVEADMFLSMVRLLFAL